MDLDIECIDMSQLYKFLILYYLQINIPREGCNVSTGEEAGVD